MAAVAAVVVVVVVVAAAAAVVVAGRKPVVDTAVDTPVDIAGLELVVSALSAPQQLLC
jgi:hypothetical protein